MSFMKKVFIFLMLYFSMNIGLFSQSTVTGYITDEEKQPISFANVVVKSDSSIIAGTVTDTLGFFEITDINCNSCQICFSFIGYKDTCLPYSKEQPEMHIVLQEDKLFLEQVIIKGKRSFIKNEDNKTIINIQNSLLSSSESAQGLLKYLPGIIKTQSGYEYFGKGAPLILINGKPTKSDAELENLKPENIIEIEMYENRGEFDASSQYIINYKTKTLKDYFGGQAYNRTTYNPRFNNDVKLWLVLNRKKVNQNLFMKNYTGYYPWKEKDEITNYDQNGNTLYFQRIELEATDFSSTNTIQYNIDYRIDSMQNIGLQLYYDNSRKADEENFTSTVNDLTYINENTIDGKRNSLHSSVNYDLKFFNDINFSILGDHYLRDSDKTRTLHQNDVTDKITENNNYEIVSLKTDLLVPILKFNANVKIGAKASDITNKNNAFQELNTIGGLEDLNNSNVLEERTYAMYLQLRKKLFDKMSILAATRYETFSREINDITNEEENKWTKNDFFPNIAIQYQLLKQISLSANYHKYIDRSSYSYIASQDLYLNPYLYRKSNMYLVPAIIDRYSLSSTLFNTFNIKFEYVKHNNYTTMFFERNDSITFITYDNTNKEDINLLLGGMLPIKKSVTSININLNKPYFTYKVFNKDVTTDVINYSIGLHNTTPLVKNFVFEGSLQYRSRQQMDLFYFDPQWYVQMGIKKFFTRNFRISAYYTYQSIRKYIVEYENIKIDQKLTKTPNSVFISLLYKFNFSKKWSTNKSALDHEIYRIN